MAGEIVAVRMRDIDRSDAWRVGRQLSRELRKYPENQIFLTERQQWDQVERYIHVNVAERHTENLQRIDGEQKKLGSIALLDSSSNRAVGMASYLLGLPLNKQVFPLPAGLTRGLKVGSSLIHNPLVKVMPQSDLPNITAWMTVNAPIQAGLEVGYQAAREAVQEDHDGVGVVWAVEPTRSYPYVHEAIESAGLGAIDTGRFDMRQPSQHVPQRSHLYSS